MVVGGVAEATRTVSFAGLMPLDLSSFERRGSAILEKLREQEVRREELWLSLQKAKAKGDALKRRAAELDEKMEAVQIVEAPISVFIVLLL